MEKIILEIGCPPGNPRPDSVLKQVLEKTALSPDDFTLLDTLFGDWSWQLKEGKEKAYAEAKDTIGKRLSKLYDNKTIRYAKW